MSKRIVVGLDPSGYCKTAVDFACQRAAMYDGTVIGVGVIDMPGIEAAGRGAGVGASHFAKKAREHHLKEAEETVTQLLEELTQVCRQYGVTCEALLRSGSPISHLVEEAKAADLIVIGARTFFHFETQEEPGNTLNGLLKAQVCPVVVVPEHLEEPFRRVIFPYDGSRKAARSMRSFVNLTHALPIAVDVVLLRVREDVEAGLEDLERPAKYLRAYGYKVELRVVPGEARDVILEQALTAMPTVVVLGASAKSNLRALLFGSVTRKLLDNGTIPLYVTP